jgi:hypothetical protein
MRRELSPSARLPLFALAVVIAAAVVALLFVLHPARHPDDAARNSPTSPPPVVIGSSRFTGDAQRVSASREALRVGRRFLRLYVRLQTTPPDAVARRELRSLTSLALAHTLLGQPPAPAGGGRAPQQLARVRAEPLSASDLRLHARIRQRSSLLRVRCLVQRDQGRWTVTALSAAG